MPRAAAKPASPGGDSPGSSHGKGGRGLVPLIIIIIINIMIAYSCTYIYVF